MLVQDYLDQALYDARLVGTHYSLKKSLRGIGLSVKGYTETVPRVLTIILEEIRYFVVDLSRFSVAREQVSPSALDDFAPDLIYDLLVALPEVRQRVGSRLVQSCAVRA